MEGRTKKKVLIKSLSIESIKSANTQKNKVKIIKKSSKSESFHRPSINSFDVKSKTNRKSKFCKNFDFSLRNYLPRKASFCCPKPELNFSNYFSFNHSPANVTPRIALFEEEKHKSFQNPSSNQIIIEKKENINTTIYPQLKVIRSDSLPTNFEGQFNSLNINNVHASNLNPKRLSLKNVQIRPSLCSDSTASFVHLGPDSVSSVKSLSPCSSTFSLSPKIQSPSNNLNSIIKSHSNESITSPNSKGSEFNEDEKIKISINDNSKDWHCMRCKNVNFSFRSLCNRCKLSRIDSNQIYEKNINKLIKYNEISQGSEFVQSVISNSFTNSPIQDKKSIYNLGLFSFNTPSYANKSKPFIKDTNK